ncbi:MAG TPA: hypothetical protein ENO00_00625 [Deltaproteobacteria bacterium]|nr:hypothetical protein [Deltaproteobacteria bacterium]
MVDTTLPDKPAMHLHRYSSACDSIPSFCHAIVDSFYHMRAVAPAMILYEIRRRIPRPVDGDECGAAARGMQSPSFKFLDAPPCGRGNSLLMEYAGSGGEWLIFP